MYFNNLKVEALKGFTKIYYDEGYTIIGKNTVWLDPDSYTKREKIYVNRYLVETKPIVLYTENKKQ